MTELRYTVHPSPVGDLLLASTDEGLVTLHVLGDDAREQDAHLASLAVAFHTLPARDDDADEVRRQLDEYFDGDRTVFDIPMDWSLVHGFGLRALQCACEIPYGQTAAYGEIAVLAGAPRAGRAVGNACSRSPFSIVVPVHRVVHADGSIGGYGGGVDVKRDLLEHERRTLAYHVAAGDAEGVPPTPPA